jgi:hypothetical protein
MPMTGRQRHLFMSTDPRDVDDCDDRNTDEQAANDANNEDREIAHHERHDND